MSETAYAPRMSLPPNIKWSYVKVQDPSFNNNSFNVSSSTINNFDLANHKQPFIDFSK